MTVNGTSNGLNIGRVGGRAAVNVSSDAVTVSGPLVAGGADHVGVRVRAST